MSLYRLTKFGITSLILLSVFLLPMSVSQAQSAGWWEWFCNTFPESTECQPYDYSADVCEEPEPADRVCIDEDGDGEDDNADPADRGDSRGDISNILTGN